MEIGNETDVEKEGSKYTGSYNCYNRVSHKEID
jgi:hypothetical protein